MSVIKHYRYQDLEGIRVGRFNLGVNTTFIVYRLGSTVIDTGPSNQWRYVKLFIESRPLKQLLLTHHHEDHSGNADAIHRLTGVQPIGPARTVDILKRGFRIPPMQRLFWGSPNRAEVRELPGEITVGGESTEAIFTPGHAKDMHCYLLPERGWLFSADLYIANYLKLLRSDEDVGILLHSIGTVLERDFDTILCPHRGVVENGKQKLREKYDYLLNLASDAQELRQEGLALVEITRRLLGKEGMVGIVSRYNFSKRNLIASCLEVDLGAFPRQEAS
ncbi:MBL fold metallo-hydrolase [Microbulbifer flavimaris]|uniref:MBL fold metallo-hydrolase n=1 Tax=Microbulbifer flavimaris TaxID=1781068 RepID=A0ABX4HX45_9GAMM|nr:MULTISPECIES: MBL fold metallo-hydrolase [Microbulbifer]KUJ81681.1 MBL fold metallo-hydrolase [Microbulbifer sp. ZGT114]PCO04601.1 MBL fold metallo-hydrolase [Microbulbifer flavimaris]